VGREGRIGNLDSARLVADDAADLPDPSALNGVVDVVPVTAYRNQQEEVSQLMVIGDRQKIINDITESDLEAATPNSIDISNEYEEIVPVSSEYELDGELAGQTPGSSTLGEWKSGQIENIDTTGQGSIAQKIARMMSINGIRNYENTNQAPEFVVNAENEAIDGRNLELVVTENGGTIDTKTVEELVNDII